MSSAARVLFSPFVLKFNLRLKKWHAVRPTEETHRIWPGTSGTLISNPGLRGPLLLKGCELETYFGIGMQMSIPSSPISLYKSIYLHSHSLRELWELIRNFRGYLYRQRFIYACVCTNTRVYIVYLEKPGKEQ